jgi:hypothetical protein
MIGNDLTKQCPKSVKKGTNGFMKPLAFPSEDKI